MTNPMPLVAAMDAFDRFWTAALRCDEDWTAWAAECECGNCKRCGMAYVLGWTNALLSNPSLADFAEAKRENPRLTTEEWLRETGTRR